MLLVFLSAPISRSLSPIDRELEQQRQWGLRKRHLKTECTLLQTLSVIALTPSRPIRQMVEKFFGSWIIIIKDCIEIQVKEKKVVVLCCRPQQNDVKWGRFTPSSCCDGKQKSVTQSCCFYFKPIAFSPFWFLSPSSFLVSSLISFQEVTILLVISNKHLPRDKSNESSGDEIGCHRISYSYRVRYSLLWN